MVPSLDGDDISISSGAEFSDDDLMDDISDSELIPHIQKPAKVDTTNSWIIVDGCPIVGEDRLGKMRTIVRSKFAKVGKILDEFIPQAEDGTTTGYMFFQYSTPQTALEAMRQLNGKVLDRAHTFQVNLLPDYEQSVHVKDKWTPPDCKEFKDKGDLGWWLLDETCRDQFATVSGNHDTAVYWHSPVELQMIEDRKRWTEGSVRWSPRGSYLATTHGRGVALWGGEKFEQMRKFPHPGVTFIDFSPCERFLVTFSPQLDSPEGPKAIIVWDIQTGLMGRDFTHEVASTWPVFKWSNDGNYFARIQEDMIQVYEAKDFGLLDKKSLKLPGVKDFTWSPTQNVIAYWVPESNNSPARVVLVEIPSRVEICMKNLFSVKKIEMIWQNSGEYLSVLVKRYTKKKAETGGDQMKYFGQYVNFEIFRLTEKECPVEQMEVKEPVIKFAWEPCGSRFAILHGDATSTKTSVALYDVKQGTVVEQIRSLDRSSVRVNDVQWSPKGQFLVVAGMKSAGGYVEFLDGTDGTSILKTEHPSASDMQWDPTGRFIATIVTFPASKQDHGVWLWSMTGRLLHKKVVDKLLAFTWRPRPPSLLNDKQIKELKKNMKKYSGKFEMEDKMMFSRANKELMERRRKLFNEFQSWREKLRAQYVKEKPMRLELRGGLDTDGLDNMTETEETLEFLINVTTTIEKKNTAE